MQTLWRKDSESSTVTAGFAPFHVGMRLPSQVIDQENFALGA
jgi:hypothetical protein